MCRKRRLSSFWYHLLKARVFKSAPPPPPAVGYRGSRLRTSLVGAQDYIYQRFPLSKPVVGQKIALHAVPAFRASTYLVLPSRLIQLHFPQISPILIGGMCSESLYVWYEYIFRPDMILHG